MKSFEEFQICESKENLTDFIKRVEDEVQLAVDNAKTDSDKKQINKLLNQLALELNKTIDNATKKLK